MSIFEKINGRSLRLEYEKTGYKFDMEYISEEKLKWNALHELSQGEESFGIENYYSEEISNEIYSVNWIEKDGLTVSQIINFNTNEVYAFLTWNDEEKRGNRDSIFQKGKFELK